MIFIINYDVNLYLTKNGRLDYSRPVLCSILSHLGPEFRVLCFFTSVPNRVWGSMGPPCLTYLASYILVVARADLYLQRVCAGWIPSCFQTKPGPGGHSFSAGPNRPAEDPVS